MPAPHDRWNPSGADAGPRREPPVRAASLLRALAYVLPALLLRLDAFAPQPFFCDAPVHARVIADGSMRIQFPGYVPYHLLLRSLSGPLGSVQAAALWVSIVAGTAAVLLLAATARELRGPAAGAWVAAATAISPLPLYFSAVATSYALDLLTVSAMLFGGVRYQRWSRFRDLLLCAGALGLGAVMRPLSLAFTAGGVLWLCLTGRHRRWLPVPIVLGGASAGAFLALSLPYYGDFATLFEEALELRAHLRHVTLINVLTTWFRAVAYPLYMLHAWLALAVLEWRMAPAGGGAREDRRRLVRFCVALGLPYLVLLFRYIPHAGYWALLAPIALLAPCIAAPGVPFARVPVRWAAVFVALAALQWFALGPTPVRGPVSLVANAYLLPYSRAGLRQQRYETLASLARASGVLADRIPAERQQELASGAK